MTDLVAGRFALIDRIGSGGAATVWRAYDHRQRRYCAAKLVSGHNADVLIRVVREQGLRLTHPHVLSPYTWAAEDDGVLVAAELIHGGTLLALIRDHGALPWRYACEIVLQLLSAIGHVHAAGLLHRDVKPSNVLLEATGAGAPHVRLADFGIAQPADGPRLTETGFVVGTPGYLAPEILAGRAPQPSQDLFALGVLAWQLLAGEERPQNRTGDAAPPGVPEQVWTVVSRLLTTDPAGRRDATDVHAHLSSVVSGSPLLLPARSPFTDEPVEVYDILGALPPGWAEDGPAGTASPPPVPQPPAPQPPVTRVAPNTPATRTPVYAVLAAVLVAAAVGGGILLLNQGNPDPGSTPPSGTSSATPTTTTPKPVPRNDIQVDGVCNWQDVASQEVTASGVTVRCVQQPGGGYRWKPAT